MARKLRRNKLLRTISRDFSVDWRSSRLSFPDRDSGECIRRTAGRTRTNDAHTDRSVSPRRSPNNSELIKFAKKKTKT